jgi:hypothetical protein
MSDKSWNRKVTEDTLDRLKRKPSAVELKESMELSRNERKALANNKRTLPEATKWSR